MLKIKAGTTHWTDNPQHNEAVVVPNVARALLGLLSESGLSTERVCRGLGFGYDELLDLEMRLSYRQTRSLITRTQRALRDPALGLSTGSRQTTVSWGLAGLAMLTCKTLGEAITYGLEHQGDTGALLEHRAKFNASELVIAVKSKVFDIEIEPFLVEEAFSSAVAIVRRLVGPSFNPLRVELSYARPAYADAYRRSFRCPVKFMAGGNRLVSGIHWLNTQLPDYDDITCGPLRAHLDKMLIRHVIRNELIETVLSQIRLNLQNPEALQVISNQLNMSERTLRRKLTELGITYSELFDQIRHERARDLLRHTDMKIADIGHAIGFSDAHSFRRAFKRWSGMLPGEHRQA
ncbi:MULTISPECIES: AraC family transcriptional regulator [unclassified Pseudomonas]|uniref:AraC family transcriptional regulator n=1 Tax=unclassified Pseudomonas TaxID=196821 RepID=UPI00087688BC|nr:MULTISPECIES: AraC family transcriptional regulator [unclassified Pseudomonas]SCZ31539.1 AraC-type DNA-binding protein [Pseudomonas sp. NFACC44-2]SDA42926.1 AraC-type DNA-binding protein [Pseudomonas sp. NFACC51]SDX84619.1 AraC-type DNA-binding protein [Pseudomonas sp. NFACC08-1]SFH55537.1 AraC-type DNA-binding protein [Pseudomonas sp. NFACC54]SFT04787.1 AraC-type DNA-binding protein [Pseudomonas sp. NFACC48-1]